LKKNRIGYVEYFHAIIEKSLFKRFFRRGRIAFYIRSVDFCFMVLRKCGFYRFEPVDIDSIDFSAFSKEEEMFVKPIVEKHLEGLPLVEF
jgi:hypothetical protein